MTRREKNRRQRQIERQRRFDLRLRGLTSRGTPRKLEIWPKHLFHGCTSDADRKLIRQQITRARNLAAGGRYDGKPRKNKRWPQLSHIPEHKRNIIRTVINQRTRRSRIQPTPLDRAWHNFRDSLSL